MTNPKNSFLTKLKESLEAPRPSRIRIRNFGPVRQGYLADDGWMDIQKVTVLIGNQGSGKSTVAKLISTFSWIEKALVRRDRDAKWFERKGTFVNQLLTYHRLENYRTDDTVIEYAGQAYRLRYEKGMLHVTGLEGWESYLLPQIMYVPAERNFIAYVKTAKELRLSSPSLQEFLTEFDNALDELKGPVPLPVNNASIEYDKLNDTVNLRGTGPDGYKLKLPEASSGFQSLVPLYLVSDYLTRAVADRQTANQASMSTQEVQRFSQLSRAILEDENLTDEQKRIAVSGLSPRFNKRAFINIVEEPEQNLFPTSQRQLLNSLLTLNNAVAANKLVLTTHSPYLINYLTLAVKAAELKQKVKNDSALQHRLQKIVPLAATVATEDLVVYELHETDGSIQKLDMYLGVPSDENELNEKLGEGNELFAQLLEIQVEALRIA